jgi:hypothetical protein
MACLLGCVILIVYLAVGLATGWAGAELWEWARTN